MRNRFCGAKTRLKAKRLSSPTKLIYRKKTSLPNLEKPTRNAKIHKLSPPSEVAKSKFKAEQTPKFTHLKPFQNPQTPKFTPYKSFDTYSKAVRKSPRPACEWRKCLCLGINRYKCFAVFQSDLGKNASKSSPKFHGA